MSPPNHAVTAATWRSPVQHDGTAGAAARFDARTVNADTYRPWPVQPRQPHGDRYESPFAPSQTTFDARTTNSLTYRGQQLPDPCADRTRPAGVATNGSGPLSLLDVPDPRPRDFGTAYRSDFDRPSTVRMLSRSQAAVLLRELRMRKRKREAAAMTDPAAVKAAAGGVVVPTGPVVMTSSMKNGRQKERKKVILAA